MAQNTDDIKQKSKQNAEQAIDEYLKKLREIENDSKVDVPQTEIPKVDSPTIVPPTGAAESSDAVTAPGYNPNYNVHPGDSSVPSGHPVGTRPNLNDENKDKEPSGGAKPVGPSTPPNSRESAPDIGKDYGDGIGAPGYNQYPNSEHDKAHKTDDKAEKRETGAQQNQAQNQTPDQADGAHKGLEKKDGLDDKKNKGLDDNSPKADKADSQKEKKSDKGEDVDAPLGPQNGYGALNNRKGAPQPGVNDSTSRARRNLEHSNRMRQGEQGDNAKPKQNTANKSNANANGPKKAKVNSNPGLGSKIKNRLSNLGKDKNDASSATGKQGRAGEKFKTAVKRKLFQFLATHPFIAIVIGVVLLFIIILIAVELENNTSGSGKGTHCTYNLSGVSTSGEVKLEGLQVELINCDGTASNYTVLETVDFEKYVLGVALAEIGAESPDEAIKAQIVAARGFALTRNSGMCPGNQDGCFYGYNASTGKIRMRACEADQVYWDYEKDIYRQDRGAISVYSPEINSGTLWKSALNETRKAHVLELANDVKGKVLVDSSKKVVSTNYAASISQQFIDLSNQGKDYEQILSTVYADSDGFSSGVCTSYGNIDYGDYVLSSDGDEVLHQPLDSFLQSKGTSVEEFSELIASNVQKAGYGTRAGVVAAAVTLIGELGNKYDVKVPYFWGGGHYDGVVDGVLGYWGSTQCHTYANNTSYNYCGFDCSGFVPWAIKNGGFNIAQMLAGDFQNLSGARRVTLTNSAVLEPGDLLESSGHIVLVIGIEESTGNYICAEAGGNSSGVSFTRRPFNSGSYWGVDMTGFYDTHVRGN